MRRCAPKKNERNYSAHTCTISNFALKILAFYIYARTPDPDLRRRRINYVRHLRQICTKRRSPDSDSCDETVFTYGGLLCVCACVSAYFWFLRTDLSTFFFTIDQKYWHTFWSHSYKRNQNRGAAPQNIFTSGFVSGQSECFSIIMHCVLPSLSAYPGPAAELMGPHIFNTVELTVIVSELYLNLDF